MLPGQVDAHPWSSASPPTTPPSQSLKRLDFLDALRGLAAVLVLLHHVYQTFPFCAGIVRFTPLRILLTGRSSVIFFFILSGYVLAHGIWATSAPKSVTAYALRRLIRIYVPYAAAGCIALALYLVVGAGFVSSLGQTFNDMWAEPLSMPDVAKYFLLVGTTAANRLDTPAWSLVYEIRISIFMPLLCASYMRRPRTMLMGSILVFLSAEALLIITHAGLTPYAGEDVLQNLIITLHFTVFFIAGMALCRASLDRSAWLQVPSVTQRRIMAVLATCLVLIMRDAAIAVGSALILYLCLTSPRAQKILSHPILLFLGRISFSLYLTHMVVIEFFMRVTQGRLPPPVALVIATALALATAWLFFRCVEGPAHHLAKWAGRMSFERRGVHAGSLVQGYVAPSVKTR